MDVLFFPRLRLCKQPAKTRVYPTFLVHIPLAQATFRILEPPERRLCFNTLLSQAYLDIIRLVQPQHGCCHVPHLGQSRLNRGVSVTPWHREAFAIFSTSLWRLLGQCAIPH
jgi:hypothetical protein